VPLQLGLYRIANLPDTGYLPDSVQQYTAGYRIPDIGYRILQKDYEQLQTVFCTQ